MIVSNVECYLMLFVLTKLDQDESLISSLKSILVHIYPHGAYGVNQEWISHEHPKFEIFDAAMLLELILLRCVDGQEQIFFDVSHCLLSSTAVSMSVSVSIRPHRPVGPASQGHLRGHILAHLNVFLLAVLCFVLHFLFLKHILEKDVAVPNLYTQENMKSPFRFSLFGVCTKMLHFICQFCRCFTLKFTI